MRRGVTSRPALAHDEGGAPLTVPPRALLQSTAPARRVFVRDVVSHVSQPGGALMRKRKTRESMADQDQQSSSKVPDGSATKAARVTPVPKGARRPPPTPTEEGSSSYDVSVPFEFRNWQLGSRFHIKKFLGRGSYGSVCEATDKVTGQRVAIKRITDLFDVRVSATVPRQGRGCPLPP